jgi:hypothetical protein
MQRLVVGIVHSWTQTTEFSFLVEGKLMHIASLVFNWLYSW